MDHRHTYHPQYFKMNPKQAQVNSGRNAPKDISRLRHGRLLSSTRLCHCLWLHRWMLSSFSRSGSKHPSTTRLLLLGIAPDRCFARFSRKTSNMHLGDFLFIASVLRDNLIDFWLWGQQNTVNLD